MSVAAAFDEVHTTPPRSPQNALMAAAELIYVTGTTAARPPSDEVTEKEAAVAFVQFGTLEMTLAVSGIALIITTLEGFFLTPTLIGKAAQMNRVAVFAGLLFWTWLWGVWGLLLAVPLMMTAKVICDRVEGLQPIGRFLGE